VETRPPVRATVPGSYVANWLNPARKKTSAAQRDAGFHNGWITVYIIPAFALVSAVPWCSWTNRYR
jgi:hypothetical protein